MKSFISKILLFSSFIIVFIAIGEILVRRVPNPYSYKHQWMRNNAQKIETLVLGSSHTYFGVNPERFTTATFNLAFTSQNFEYDYYLLHQYVEQCSSLKNLIIPISYFSLFSKGLEGGKYWWYCINYKIYMDCDIHSDFSKYNFEFSHLSVWKGKLLSILKPSKNLQCTDLGMGTAYAIDNKMESWNDAKAAIERHTAKDFDGLGKNLIYLNKIITLCNAKGINTILITTPTWHTYYKGLDRMQLAKMYEVIENLLLNNNHIQYYDFLTDNRFVEDDFYDSDHLSNIGADKFSEILNTLIE
jgi:hypothetical protein